MTIDTGAEVTLVRSDLIENLLDLYDLVVTEQQLVLADGNGQLPVLGKIDLTVKLDDFEVVHQVYVVKNCPCQCFWEMIS